MDKLTSVLAALEAGKMPTTQQLTCFVDWLNTVGITKVEPAETGDLSSQGRILANDLRAVLESHKILANNKNEDNVLQEAIWHLSQSELVVTSEASADVDKAKQDLDSIRRALRTLLAIFWSSLTSEGSALFQDFVSFTRLALSDAAELLEEAAGRTKETLREQERGFREGERDVLGRDKKRLEEEKDIKVAWEHGMDTVKEAGTGVIETTQQATSSAEEKAERTRSRMRYAYQQICDRAQQDPVFKESLDTVFGILQERLNQTLDTAADPNVTLKSFINDPTPEQHVPKAINLLRTVLERLSGVPFDPLLDRLRTCVKSIVRDDDLRKWFNDFFALARRNLGEPGFARSDESRNARRHLRARWDSLLEKDATWKSDVDKLKKEIERFQDGLSSDRDVIRLREAHETLSYDIEQGLIDASAEAQTGLQAAVEQATWFWQDIFKVYLPRFLTSLKDVPIPRTEYKDAEIEFVLENLDVSSFNLLPSHVYVRNITDIDIHASASPHVPSTTAVGTLTHIRIQALQMALNDVSFWYRNKTAAVGPSDFTGLMGLTLPEKGVDVDLKVRLIPANTSGPRSREALKHFHWIDKVEVKISDDIGLEVKESNHPILLSVFRPLMLMRLRDALERSLTEQLRGIITWFDGVAFDISKRREVFEDTGIGSGASLIAAIWSEFGRIQREHALGLGETDWRATGTGMVVEHYAVGESGEPEKKASFAMGAEPQILSGSKHGPLGTGSESLRERMGGVIRDVEGRMDVDVGGAMQEGVRNVEEVQQAAKDALKAGRRQVLSFRRSIETKAREERKMEGWKTNAFDLA
ncbi:hypothetical protein AMATHDRAFT_151108 [Amanita thiersii Skay4041]|uniref:Uncharacterized protein n=1 Tax=Amanita thiersii Skay4041 TaxID=703135 RepID=A0A2A9NHY0_9AGAR|nr:hypothetical protein AMATHDRAFT_151108 [Amanita thiersii Skay4041]